MTFDEKLKAVYKKASLEKFTYPQLFDALKAEGVHSYNVDVTSHKMEYFGDHEHVVHDGPAEFKAPVGQFNEPGVVLAIRRAQRRETDYSTFLKEIAAAGISHYRVDMKERAVSYFGQDPMNKYVEKVP